MKKLLLIPLLLFCVTAFGQWTKPQLYSNINTNIRLKTYSPTRLAAMLDSIVVSMGSGGSMVYPGAGIPLSTGSAWGTSITDNSANWNTAYGWGNHAGLYRPIGYVPSWSEITSKPTTIAGYGITDFNSLGDARWWKLSGTNTLTGTTSITGSQELNFGTYGSPLYAQYNVATAYHQQIVKATSDNTTLLNPSGFEISLSNPASVFKFIGPSAPSVGDVWTASNVDGTGYWAAPSGVSGLTTNELVYGNSATTIASLPVATYPSLTELSYVKGLTSSAQTQITARLPLAGATYTTTSGSGLALTTSTLTSGSLIDLSSTGTAAASNTQKVLNVSTSGINGTSAQTTYGGYFSNTHTGTNSKNYGSFHTATSGTTNFAIGTTGNVDIGGGLYMNGNSVFTLSGSTQLNLSPSTLFYNGHLVLRSGSTSGITLGNGVTTIPTFGLRIGHTNTMTNTSGKTDMIFTDGGFSPTSGTADFNGFLLSNTFNQTGGANGVLRGFNSNPIFTAAAYYIAFDHSPVSGSATSELAFRGTQGDFLLGGSTITASTRMDLRGKGGAVTDNILRLATSANTEVFNFKENGHYNSGTYNERPITGTSSGTSFSETIYASTEISNGEAVTIGVLWSVADLDTNTGAGGTFYTTWTKSGGTLAKSGDNQLVTNNNTGDTFTVSTSDSGGNISLTISSTGSSGNWKGNGQVFLIKKL